MGLLNETLIKAAGLRAVMVYELALAVLLVVLCEEIRPAGW